MVVRLDTDSGIYWQMTNADCKKQDAISNAYQRSVISPTEIQVVLTCITCMCL